MIKKIITLFLFCISFSLTGFAQDALNEAEELFRAGKFANALAVYENELKNHTGNPYIYYNIGNCYFKMGSIGLAVANYYRAFKLNPRDADIRHNLDLALRAGGTQLVPAGIPHALHKVFFYFSYEELQGLTYALFWLCCVSIGLWLVIRKGKYIALTCTCVAVLSAGWLFWRESLENENLAVIAAPIAEVRSGPGDNFPPSANIAQGHLVIVEDEKDNWYEVIIKAQGLKGWVAKDAIKTI